MRTQTTEEKKKPFWYYIEGDRAGIQHYVKNLDWLMERANKVTAVVVSKSRDGKAYFQAVLEGGINFACDFESYGVAEGFAKRKFFNARLLLVPEGF
jgi:hypothetical protein